jgi:peptide chain release factor subunit 1
MKSDRFRTLAKADGPFASVYFDDSHDTPDARSRLELLWNHIEEQLTRRGAAGALADRVHKAYDDAPMAVGRRGLAIVAGTDAVLTQRLDRVPDALTVRVADQPYLLPIIEHAANTPTYVVAIVDHVGADITVHHENQVDEETVEAGDYPVHKAAGAESPGYGDPQPRAEEAARRNVRAVAERVTTLVDEVDPAAVFVVGEVRSRSDLVTDLPKRVAGRAVQANLGARHGVDDAVLRDFVAEYFEMDQAESDGAVLQRFQAERNRASGLATEGLPGVCAALRDGAVETLLIGELGDRTVLVGESHAVVAPNADVMSELGAQSATTVRADEALPLAAIAIDAELVAVGDGAAPRDGIGAVLRYAPRTSAAT